MSDPTRKDAGLPPDALHIEIVLNPLTKEIAIADNTGGDPILFAAILARALDVYMTKKMGERAKQPLPMRPLTLPSRMQ